MNVLLLQLDGKLPNLALMAIACHHRELGDTVTLRQCRRENSVRDLFDAAPGRVYASLIFERSRHVAEAVRREWPDAIVGGTGWSLTERLDDYGIDAERHDYSDYPGFRMSMGFTQRGCRFSCPFCKVPESEGKVRPVSTIADIWRGGSWPRELLLLDNDFFGQPEWLQRIEEIRGGRFRVSFNQGINARVLSDEAAEAIASVDFRDDGMSRRRIYTAWDNRDDARTLFRGLARLVKAGVKPDEIVVYMLIGYWAGETESDWLYRQARLREFGARPYPMPYRRDNSLQMGFQRWCIRAADKRVSWQEYKRVNCRPEKAVSGLMPLFVGSAFPSEAAP